MPEAALPAVLISSSRFLPSSCTLIMPDCGLRVSSMFSPASGLEEVVMQPVS